MDEENLSQNLQSQVQCPNCGGTLVYLPGSKSLQCEHCSSQVTIEESPEKVEEIDFEAYLKQNPTDLATEIVFATRCQSCGAIVKLDRNIVSDRCPFCSSVLIIKNNEFYNRVKPGAILPFQITKAEAFNQFKRWLKNLWFAPNKLVKTVSSIENFTGVYIPFWTYDADTFTTYRGERGDIYYVTETYTDFENGKPVTKTRTVTKIRWTPVSGRFSRFFDDVLVLASQSLPKEKTEQLEPWDLENLVPYDERYLSGYRAETYQIDLKEGFSRAQSVIESAITAEIKQRIGGDRQRILSCNVKYSKITYKHIFLPVYISSYKYGKKLYQFLVNARTGEVQGERPYSFWKIFFTALLGIALLVGLWYWIKELG